MVVNWQDVTLALAGIIGSGVAVVHGVLTQRLVVQPFQELAKTRLAAGTRRLVPGLLHFTTFNWFIGGLVLLVAAYSFDQEARLATGLLVGSSYLFGAVGNLWATRGRHPGWVLYTIALILIAYGIGKPGA
jgi:uncharacterized oligopeptide transporter (OPT) family protein